MFFYTAAKVALTLGVLACAAPPQIAQAAPPAKPAPATQATHGEFAFSLPNLSGNPFDYRENNIEAVIQTPQGKQTLFAFFDGGNIWRVRFPFAGKGTYKLLGVTRNKSAIKASVQTGTLTVRSAVKTPGFVRLDAKNKTKFIFDNGAAYYPVGSNAAWKSGDRPDIDELFNRMGVAGENWSRVWMNHWDGKNLDWPRPQNTSLGTLNLNAARRWDGIVTAAEKNKIYFQMTLQHHGQYSTRVNPNWGENPWNAALPGGFLKTPDEFFTNEKARNLTRAKYRYIVARWGYSPSILAWELFNEVQFTDAINDKQADKVAAWHKEMAAFLRSADKYHHLVTTSSDVSIPHLYDSADYIQPHSYPVDGVQTVLSVNPSDWNKPIFYGEIGPPDAKDTTGGVFLHNLLWASLVSGQSGVAQYWSWDELTDNNWWSKYASVTGFLALPDALSVVRDTPANRTVSVDTADLSPVSFGPGGSWGKGEQTRFVVESSGKVDGAGKMPAFLQGTTHPDLFTRAEFAVDFPRPGTFAVSVRQSAKAGAHLVVFVDDQKAGERDFPRADADQTVTGPGLSVAISQGKHTVRLENTGTDWVVLQNITLAPYGPGMRVLAKGDSKRAVVWVYRPAAAPDAAPITGVVTLPDFAPGAYRLIWWDTHNNKPLMPAQTATIGASKTLKMQTPPIAGDAAALIVPVR